MLRVKLFLDGRGEAPTYQGPSPRRAWACPATGGESHEGRVEVEVGGGPLGARGVAAELVLVAGPGTVGDLLAHAGAEHGAELRGGAFDAFAELGRAPVRGR